MINILLASDDNYAPLMGVTICSFLENNRDSFEKINIYVIDKNISERNKYKIISMINKEDNNIFIKFINDNNIEDVVGLKIHSTRALSAYSRLFADSLLDGKIDKILYLDCDALVTNSFKQLWQMNIDDYYCAGVLDAGPKYIKTLIGLSEDDDYYNSGFLLMNLKKWREDKLENKFVDYLKDHDGKVFHNDQGIINAVCFSKLLKLHPKYNILSPFFEVRYED
ncbi:glycosyltransferase family 8 protein, partial [Methanobrevibacter sp. OttesenSCG-928-I08]|nr:glycosyltransferase family 8 protein [Methanobrevibacter sp. OttesenSCG-928-I08]